MARLGNSRATRLELDNAAAADNEAVRKLELDAEVAALEAAKAAVVHTHANDHPPLSLTADGALEVVWDSGLQSLEIGIRLDPSGGLMLTGSGLSVDWGPAHGQVPHGDEVAAADSGLAVEDTNSVDLTLAAGVLSAAVRRSSSGIRLAEDTGGLYIPTGGSGVAEYDHSHAAATEATAGFLSAADKRKLNRYQELTQLNVPVLFTRAEALSGLDYVGGKKRFGQRMKLTRANLTALAPDNDAALHLLVNDSGTGDSITIPAGASGLEVSATADFTNLYLEPDVFARWRADSGIGAGPLGLASRIDLELNVEPALDDVPEYQINCGGGAEAPYVEDAYYSGGSTVTLAGTVNTTGASDPAPESVYRSKRYSYDQATSTPLVYTLTGLGRGVDYRVRLHFCETAFTEANRQLMRLEITGATTETEASYDVYTAAGGSWRAVVKEFTLKADNAGEIEVRLVPLLNSSGVYNLSLNGLEVVPT